MELIIYNRNSGSKSIKDFYEQMSDSNLHFFASELLSYGFKNMSQIDIAVERAIQICKVAAVPLRKNFKAVYLSENGSIVCDYKLSSLGRKLVILNADASIPFVARVQLELINKEIKYVKI